MTLLAIIFLFVRTTLLFAGTQGVLRAVRHSSAATRHWICLVSLVGSLLLPLTLLAPRGAIALRVDALPASLLAATPVRGNLQPVAVVCAIWLGGVALLLFRLACGHWSIHQIALRGSAAGIVDGVRVRSAEVPVPLVTGLFRPTILLPENASEWHVNHRDAALRHELAHLTRKDLWSSFAASLACALWWFHPLAWKLAARQQTEQESACDDAVIAGVATGGLRRGPGGRGVAAVSIHCTREHYVYQKRSHRKNSTPRELHPSGACHPRAFPPNRNMLCRGTVGSHHCWTRYRAEWPV